MNKHEICKSTCVLHSFHICCQLWGRGHGGRGPCLFSFTNMWDPLEITGVCRCCLDGAWISYICQIWFRVFLHILMWAGFHHSVIIMVMVKGPPWSNGDIWASHAKQGHVNAMPTCSSPIEITARRSVHCVRIYVHGVGIALFGIGNWGPLAKNHDYKYRDRFPLVLYTFTGFRCIFVDFGWLSVRLISHDFERHDKTTMVRLEQFI